MSVARYIQQDVWLALGGDGPSFDRWRDEDPRRSDADAWAQLMAAVAGNMNLLADTNPPAGDDLVALFETRLGITEEPQ